MRALKYFSKNWFGFQEKNEPLSLNNVLFSTICHCDVTIVDDTCIKSKKTKDIWKMIYCPEPTLETNADHQLNVCWSRWRLHAPARRCWCLSTLTWTSSTPSWSFSSDRTINSQIKKKFCHFLNRLFPESQIFTEWRIRQQSNTKISWADEDDLCPPSRSNWKRLI